MTVQKIMFLVQELRESKYENEAFRISAEIGKAIEQYGRIQFEAGMMHARKLVGVPGMGTVERMHEADLSLKKTGLDG